MKIKNITSSLDFPAYQLLTKEPTEIKNFIQEFRALSKHSKVVSDDVKCKLEAKMSENYPDWIKKECNLLGVESVLDNISVTVNLGSVIYDLYQYVIIVPDAPLSRALLQKKLGDLAESMSSDEFELPKEVLDGLERVMTDDDIWKNALVHASYNAGNSVKGLTLNTEGLCQYKDIMNGLLNIFLPKDEEK